jgi:hypothetical protein
MRRHVERNLWRYRLEVCTEVGCLRRPHAHGIQWRIVERLFRAQQPRLHVGIALPVLKSRGRDEGAGVYAANASRPPVTVFDDQGVWSAMVRWQRNFYP